MSTTAPAVIVDRLRVNVRGTTRDIVGDISFEIAPGEVLGLVGESGSGKTTVGLALLGHTRRGVQIGGALLDNPFQLVWPAIESSQAQLDFRPTACVDFYR